MEATQHLVKHRATPVQRATIVRLDHLLPQFVRMELTQLMVNMYAPLVKLDITAQHEQVSKSSVQGASIAQLDRKFVLSVKKVTIALLVLQYHWFVLVESSRNQAHQFVEHAHLGISVLKRQARL